MNDIMISNIIYREATDDDIPFLSKIRAKNEEEEKYWNIRISGYMYCTHYPQQALDPRIIYVACINETIIGFIAGHLTQRYQCDGELEWIDVIEPYRRNGIASVLIKLLAKWFITKQVYKICIDPGNETAVKFYKKNAAEMLNSHWMFWKDIRTLLKTS